ncbi:Zn-ribbon domain-containing OB-fold protein [uncultured Shimia sp.]|uniref:Zn-ribbon domain-containing OB-fold protein n=1 Tax=uncultured Shimia sp. TaxID=573152 RepID=UPI0025E84487|nr:Zn-ribbon domain-containing OB-fold protein [uncultured Shimia sp.]
MSAKMYIDPTITMESEAYWQAANEGKLLVKRCGDCGQVHFFPRAICPECFSSNTEWQEASGKGRIYSYSVTRRAEVPYAIAYVTLEEGVTMLSNIVEADLNALAVDMPVEVVFGKTRNGQALPLFRPVEAST